MASISASLHMQARPDMALQFISPLKVRFYSKAALSLPVSPFKGATLKPLVPQKKQQLEKFKISAVKASPDYLVEKLKSEDLDKLLESKRTTPVVVDFYATWCGPCILLAQQLEMLAVEYGPAVQFVKIDTDEEYELAQQLQIRGLPTMLFISPDSKKPAIRTEGLLPNETIKTIIETEL